jgi:hypothetical protein
MCLPTASSRFILFSFHRFCSKLDESAARTNPLAIQNVRRVAAASGDALARATAASAMFTPCITAAGSRLLSRRRHFHAATENDIDVV